jgi:hypothetical protein
MSITVTCACGQSFRKPDRKAGEHFRCHACGRELVVEATPREANAGYSFENEKPTPKSLPQAPRKRRGTSVTLGRSYPVLWLGTICLALLAACSGFAAYMATTMPNPAGARAAQPPPPLWAMLIPCAVFVVLTVLLGLLTRRLTERFEANDEGITWFNRGRARASFAWSDLRYLRLEGMSLTLAGPPDAPVLDISTNYTGFDRLLSLVRNSVDWETLARARPPGAVEAEELEPRPLELPVVRYRRLPFWLAVITAVVLSVLTVAGWRLVLRPAQAAAPGPAGKPDADDKIGEYAAYAMLGLVLPALVVALSIGAFRCWTRFQVDEQGIEFQYFLRTRRYEWDDLQSVRVLLTMTEVRQHGGRNRFYNHVLQIRTKEDGDLNMGFGEDCFFFRDALAAAATRAGAKLRCE